MNTELVRCSCCGKLVSSSNIELAFRRPDEIAAMNIDEIESRCRYNNDIYVLDESRYFVRCTIPIPIIESSNQYSIGAWVEIDQKTYQRICDRWDDEDQSNEPLMSGALANSVPLTTSSLGARLNLQLTGSSTRPEIFIIDTNCSLQGEQANGISAHRASEYSDLVRE